MVLDGLGLFLNVVEVGSVNPVSSRRCPSPITLIAFRRILATDAHTFVFQGGR